MLSLQQESITDILVDSACEKVNGAGNGSSMYCETLASRSADGSGDEDGDRGVYCQALAEVLENGEAADTTMFGTTPLHSFFQLVERVDNDCIVQVVYKHKPDRNMGHGIVAGPNGVKDLLAAYNC